jgi:hypothetical protein
VWCAVGACEAGEVGQGTAMGQGNRLMPGCAYPHHQPLNTLPAHTLTHTHSTNPKRLPLHLYLPLHLWSCPFTCTHTPTSA